MNHLRLATAATAAGQLACNHVLDLVLGRGDDAKEAAARELAWWSGAARTAFDRTWSPG